jgi:phage gpG-like protein
MRIKVDTREFKKYIRGVSRREKNFRPIWDKAFDDLADAHVRNFQTGGAPVGGWAPLTGRYFNEKFRQGYGLRTLVREGDLKSAMNNFRSAGAVRSQRPTSATWGIDVGPNSPIHYAKFHQMGTRNMMERQVIFEPKGFLKNVADMAGDHLIVGKGPRGVKGRVKGIFDV